jgi:hypothetical protein
MSWSAMFPEWREECTPTTAMGIMESHQGRMVETTMSEVGQTTWRGSSKLEADVSMRADISATYLCLHDHRK